MASSRARTIWPAPVRSPNSPYARRGFVDHSEYETVSILKFIELRWHLKAPGARGARANGLTNAFDFSQQPQP
jgi:hypothetical protein